MSSNANASGNQKVTHEDHRSVLSTVFKNLRNFFKIKDEQDAMNDYLSKSTDIYDLEARMRSWNAQQRR